MKLDVVKMVLGDDSIDELTSSTKALLSRLEFDLIGKTVEYVGDGEDTSVTEKGDTGIIVGICPYFLQRVTTLRNVDDVNEALNIAGLQLLFLTKIGNIDVVKSSDVQISTEGVLQ